MRPKSVCFGAVTDQVLNIYGCTCNICTRSEANKNGYKGVLPDLYLNCLFLASIAFLMVGLGCYSTYNEFTETTTRTLYIYSFCMWYMEDF